MFCCVISHKTSLQSRSMQIWQVRFSCRIRFLCRLSTFLTVRCCFVKHINKLDSFSNHGSSAFNQYTATKLQHKIFPNNVHQWCHYTVTIAMHFYIIVVTIYTLPTCCYEVILPKNSLNFNLLLLKIDKCTKSSLFT